MDRRFDPVSRWLIDARRTVRRPLDLGRRATVAMLFVFLAVTTPPMVIRFVRAVEFGELACVSCFFIPMLLFLGHVTFTGYVLPRFMRPPYPPTHKQAGQ